VIILAFVFVFDTIPRPRDDTGHVLRRNGRNISGKMIPPIQLSNDSLTAALPRRRVGVTKE
jgi:hypothetical protein